jgi:Rrf2 family protein
MHVTARGDYALRAAIELANADGAIRTVPQLASLQHIPPRFLENILLALRRAGLLQSRRGSEGGFRLARPAHDIALADILRAVEGSLVTVRGMGPEELTYDGSAEGLRDVWLALRANIRAVLERVTLAEIASNSLPAEVRHSALMPQVGATRRTVG